MAPRACLGTKAPLCALLVLLTAGLACVQADALFELPADSTSQAPVLTPWSMTLVPEIPDPILTLLPSGRAQGQPFLTPTPDAPRPSPTPRSQADEYVIQGGDTLNGIAQRFGVPAAQIAAANGLANPEFLFVGQILTIPVAEPQPAGPSNKILPDSELVYGPATGIFFDVQSTVETWGGALASRREEVEGSILSGAAIVQLVAERYSINPLLLLALLEYQGGWLTQSGNGSMTMQYALGFKSQRHQGLFGQLSWAANELNRGYYLWRAGWAGPYIFQDGVAVNPGPGLNAGTVGVQYLFSQLYLSENWRQVVGQSGFADTFRLLFGNPFDRAIEPLLPPDLVQPVLQLPFQDGDVWSFTGGPHGAWDSGSAWAALDFAPPDSAMGCVVSNAWVVAAADGLIVASENGRVVQDLDGDGSQGTGWVVLYMHIESRDRVAVGTYLYAGEVIGHPSCEGGISDGTHVHLARKYNGEWISADGAMPFNLDGWISSGTGSAYDGYLTRQGIRVEACACRKPGNQIWR
jgi:LasA protease